MNAIIEKPCSQCRVPKPIDSYYIGTRHRGHRCDECKKLNRRNSKKRSYNKMTVEQRQAKIEKGRAYRATPAGKAKQDAYFSSSVAKEKRRIFILSEDGQKYRMLHGAKSRASRDGIEFSISNDDIVIPDYCPVLGIKIVRGVGKRHDGSPSLDRTDNTKGYVPGNVRIISNRANVLKRDGSIQEFLAVVAYMRHHGIVSPQQKGVRNASQTCSSSFE